MQVLAWRVVALGVLCFACVACNDGRTASKGEAVVPKGSPQVEASGSQDTSTLIDVASVYNGAFAVDHNSIPEATKLLSGMKNHGDYVMTMNGADGQTDFLIELAESAAVEKLRFIGPVNENDAPQKIEVAVSDSLAGKFETIGTTVLELVRNKDNYSNAFDVSIPVSAKRSGRFLRLRMFGSLKGDSSQTIHAMASFQAFGKFDKAPPLRNVKGVYHFQGDFGNDSSGGFYVALHQEGGQVEGCAFVTSSSRRPLQPERLLNRVSGGIQDGVLHLNRSDAAGADNTPGIVTFSSDGKFAHSAFFQKGSDPSLFGSVARAVGERVDTLSVACTTTQQAVQTTQQIWEETLEKDKVLQLYGVNFDLDSDVLRQESHSILDKVVAIARQKPDWTFEVAGHTDSSGSAAHNRDLSQRRALSVVNYLKKAGIDSSHLVAKGYGADKPLMPNGTAAGMSRNRRVELVRQ